MNHEPPSSASTARDESNATPDDFPAVIASITRERRKRNRLLFNKKREHFLRDYLRNIDVLIYAELAAVYYMDCSFSRFIIRALVQFMFLTPKPSFIPEPPQNRPYVGAIFGSNLFCLLLHMYYDRPAASESTRGYLHGGLAMDFIGQKGPTSKLHLFLLDILILVLQLVALGAHVKRIKVRKQSTNPAATPASLLAAPPASVEPLDPDQDLDHEERGLHRAEHHPVDIELQNLNPSGRQEEPANQTSTAEDEVNSEREALLASSMQPRSDAHIFDAFNSGEIMILDMDMVGLVSTQLTEYASASAETSPFPAGQTISDRLARGGLGFRIRIGDRTLGVS